MKKNVTGSVVRFVCGVLMFAALSPVMGTETGDHKLFEASFTNNEELWKQFKKGHRFETWNVEDGILSIRNHAKKSGGSAMIPIVSKPLPDVFSVKITFRIPAVKGGTFIADIGNVRFVSYGAGMVLTEKGAPPFYSASVGEGKLHTVIFLHEPNQVTLVVDGKENRPVPQKDSKKMIAFMAYNADMEVTSFSITADNALKSIKNANLVQNGSFEQLANGFPIHWGSHSYGVNHLDWAIDMNQFRDEFRVDEKEVFHGKYSFRMKKNSLQDPKALWECWQTLLPDTEYTLSAYMKADRENAPLSINIVEAYDGRGKKEVVLGKNWKRYSLTFRSKTGNALRAGFYPGKEGVVYIDAVQLEKGNQATDFKLSQNDIPKQNVQDFVRPEFSVTQASSQPVIDGELNDSVWKNAKSIPLINQNNPLKERSAVRIAVDHDNIYFAVECFTKDISKLKETVKEQKGPVWNDDDVEFFFRPAESGTNYYHFAVNTLGITNEFARDTDVAWRGIWQKAVKKYSDKFVVEAAIPFSSLEMSGKPARLLLNVGRGNPLAREYSALSHAKGTKISFAQHKYWGYILPGGNTKNKVANVADQKFEVFPEYSWFSSEKNLAFKLTLPKEMRKKDDIHWNLTSNDKKVASGKTFCDAAAETIIKIPNRFPAGNYAFHIKYADKTLSVPCVIRTPQQNERKTNIFRRTIIADGKEFFGYGVTWTSEIKDFEKFDQLLASFKKNGFNILELWRVPSVENVKKVLDLAQKHNIKILYCLHANKDGSTKDAELEIIKTLKDHNALLTVSILDESYGRFDQAVKNREAERLRSALDGRVPICTNEYNLGVLRKADYSHFDIASADLYFIPNHDLSELYPTLKLLTDFNPRKVINLYPISSAHFANSWREPTVEEIINQAYQAYVLEVFNIRWWCDLPYTKPVFPAMEQAKRELDEINPGKFFDGEKIDVACNSDSIRFTARKSGKKITLITVNINNEKVPSVEFTLPEPIKKGKVLFENREIAKGEKRFSDSFRPLERHVYELEIK